MPAAPKKSPQDHLSKVEAAKAEAKAETSGSTTVSMWGKDFVVLPVEDWPSSGMHAVHEYHFYGWAQKCLEPESFTLWQEIDPTLRQADEFFDQWSKITGQSVGKSPTSQQS